MSSLEGAGLLLATRNALASSFSSQFTGRGNTNETEALRSSRLNFLITDCNKVDVLFVQEADSFSVRSLRDVGFLVCHANPDLDLTKYGTAVCIRPSEGISFGEAMALPSLASLEPKGKLPTVVPLLQSVGKQVSYSWLMSLHLQHPEKDRKAKIKNYDVLRAVQEEICQDPRYAAGQAVVCGLDGNSGAKRIRALFELQETGPLRPSTSSRQHTGKVLSCRKDTCSRVLGGRLGGEEDDYFYIAGNVRVLGDIYCGPLNFPFHVDGSADFLLKKEGGTSIDRLCAVAASDHAQLEVRLGLNLEDNSWPLRAQVNGDGKDGLLVHPSRHGKASSIERNRKLVEGGGKGKGKAKADAKADATPDGSRRSKGKPGKGKTGKGKTGKCKTGKGNTDKGKMGKGIGNGCAGDHSASMKWIPTSERQSKGRGDDVSSINNTNKGKTSGQR